MFLIFHVLLRRFWLAVILYAEAVIALLFVWQVCCVRVRVRVRVREHVRVHVCVRARARVRIACCESFVKKAYESALCNAAGWRSFSKLRP